MRKALLLLAATAVALPPVALLPSTLTAQQRAELSDAERARLMAERRRQVEEDLARERPIAAADEVWIEDMTWMEVRDALREGKTTAIVATGGIEQNGPYLVTGKHNVVLEGACEDIARTLGDALCAPVMKLVPEGDIEEKTGHMAYPGTLSLREETFRAVLTDVASSLAAHGFTDIVFIGDSGGNQRGMEAVAETLNGQDLGATVHYIPEFYRYADVEAYMEEELGRVQTVDEGLHDNLYITSLMMAVDPASVRYDQRVAAGRASINGVSIEPAGETVELGRRLMRYRTAFTVEAIREAIAAVSSDQR